MTLLSIEEIDDIRQSPRAFVDIQTVEVLSDTAMYQDMQIKMLVLEVDHLKAERDRLSNLCDKWNQECDEMREDNKRLAAEIAALREERAKAISHFPTLVDSARDKTGSCIVCGFHPEMAAMWCDDYLKLKALCDQLGRALDGHCAPFLGHESEHAEALAAWRSVK